MTTVIFLNRPHPLARLSFRLVLPILLMTSLIVRIRSGVYTNLWCTYCAGRGDMRTANPKSINSDVVMTRGAKRGDNLYPNKSWIDGENVPMTHFAGVKRSRRVSYGRCSLLLRQKNDVQNRGSRRVWFVFRFKYCTWTVMIIIHDPERNRGTIFIQTNTIHYSLM